MTKTQSRITLAIVAAVAFLVVTLLAQVAAQPAEPTPTWVMVDAGPETGAAAEVPGPVTSPAAPPVGSNDDLVAKAKDVKEAYEARAEGHDLMLGLAGLAAALSWLLIAGIKRFTEITDAGKAWLPKVALGVGVIGGLAAAYAGGLPWYQALVVGAGPALSVFFHELTKPKAAA